MNYTTPLVAGLLSLGLTLASGPLVLPLLRRLRLGQRIRSQGPRRHQVKAGTPTMGGVTFLGAATVATLATVGVDLRAGAVLITVLGFGLLGFWDDYLKVARGRTLGLRARHKLTGEIALGLFVAWTALVPLGGDTGVWIPFAGRHLDLGLLYVPFVVLVVVSASNAVNISDGLDGLAAGLVMFALLPGLLAARRLGLGGLEASAAALVGGCLGFLRYNMHPASVFMGDTGSLALGGALGALAVLTDTELLLLLVGGVFAAETLSVVIQVAAFRLWGRRLFRMAPLHHHFELCGWPEQRVVNTFWFAGALLALVGLAALASR